ncbi:hypothetical protein C0J52_17634 [Blattella germanica]|nr:hypothetical protein C0J52_17634 [Blattella germanica]
MAVPSPANPLGYLVKREYNDKLYINKQLLRERLYSARNLYRKDLLAHYGCVNAIEFSNKGELLASGGDDRRVLIWNVEQAVHGVNKPAAMRAQHISNIFCLGFDSTNKPFCLASYTSAFHAVMFNPIESRILTTANSKEGVGLWDIREPRQVLMRYGGQNVAQSCMSVRFNQRGTQILALRRRLPPVLYAVDSSSHICQFDYPGYYNSCTMKSCCFAGEDDQFFWSPFPLPESTGSLMNEAEPVDKQRKVYSHEEYIRLVLRSGQREIEGWSSEESVSSELSASAFDGAAYHDNLERLQSYKPLLQHMLRRNDEPVEAQNRISQLIAKKRAQLMRLARTRSQAGDSSETVRTGRKKQKEFSARWENVSTDGSDSGREVTVNKDDSPDSDDEEAVVDKKRRKLSSSSKKNSSSSSRNGKLRSSTPKQSKKADKKSNSESRKRRVKYMLAFSESSDEDDENWKLSLKRKKLWNQSKNTEATEAKSSDTDAVSEASGEEVQDNVSSSESEPYVNEDNAKKHKKSTKKVKRLRKRRGKQSESENGVVLNDSDSNTSSEPVWYKSKRTERKNSSQSSTKNIPIKKNKMKMWNGKHKTEGRSKTLIETSSDSSENDEQNHSHKIPLRNKDNKVPNATYPEALSKLKVSQTKNVNYNCSVTTEQKDNSSESDDRDTTINNNNNNDFVVNSVVVSPVTPTIKHCNRSANDTETPDSGIAMVACSSVGSNSTFNSRPGSSSSNINGESQAHGEGAPGNDGSDDSEWMIFKRFKSRFDRARRNYRNHIGDTDSN